MEVAATTAHLRNGNSKNRSTPSVYFLAVVHTETTRDPIIKIGYSTKHAQRISQHSSPTLDYAPEVTHLCSVRGSRADESYVHRYFRQYALASPEQFTAAPQVVEYIRWLRDQWFVFVPDDELCEPLESLPSVDGTLWLPQEERRVQLAADARLFGAHDPLVMPPRQLTGDDFYTNPSIMEAVRAVLGGIDLDPASHAIANREVKAKRFFTLAQDGLKHEWRGRVWLNPPFSQWEEWLPKAMSEWNSGRISSMCVLAAMRTLSAQYFAPMHDTCSAICITRGRWKFWGGKAGDSPDDGHAIFYFGPSIDLFMEHFRAIGSMYRK